jgi:hypothetical protein
MSADPATVLPQGEAGPADRVQWLQLCRSSKHTTFFHTPYWAELFSGRYPGRFSVDPKRVRFGDGSTAIIPVVYKKHLGGLVRVACSMPAGTFGGAVSDGPLTAEQEQQVYSLLFSSSDCIVRENPYQPLQALPYNITSYEDPTQAVDLADGYSSAWKRATAAHRNAVRNAVKSGVAISEAQGEEEWLRYVTIYRASISRWRKKGLFSGVSYDEPFFLRIAALDSSLRKLWIARVNGEPVAGILCFYWNRHAVVWHGSALEHYFSYHPNNLLYDRAIEHAAQEGYRWFDCNPSGSLRGVFKFKQYLGAQTLRSRVVIKTSPLIRIVQGIRARKRGRA